MLHIFPGASGSAGAAAAVAESPDAAAVIALALAAALSVVMFALAAQLCMWQYQRRHPSRDRECTNRRHDLWSERDASDGINSRQEKATLNHKRLAP